MFSGRSNSFCCTVEVPGGSCPQWLWSSQLYPPYHLQMWAYIFILILKLFIYSVFFLSTNIYELSVVEVCFKYMTYLFMSRFCSSCLLYYLISILNSKFRILLSGHIIKQIKQYLLWLCLGWKYLLKKTHLMDL